MCWYVDFDFVQSQLADSPVSNLYAELSYLAYRYESSMNILPNLWQESE